MKKIYDNDFRLDMRYSPMCYIEITCPRMALPVGEEHVNLDFDDNSGQEQLIVFNLNPAYVGAVVHLRLIRLMQEHEWPREPVMILANRKRNGELLSSERRAMASREEHSLSSLYISGNERVTIECDFSVNGEDRESCVKLEFNVSGCPVQLDQDRVQGEGGAAQNHKGLFSGGGSKRQLHSAAASQAFSSENTSGEEGGGAFSRKTRTKGLQDPNDIRADMQEYYALLSAQAASRQDVSAHQQDISRLSCGLCAVRKTDSICQICMVRPKRVVFSPCGHYVCCKECAEHKDMKKCPYCRTAIVAKTQIYSLGAGE